MRFGRVVGHVVLNHCLESLRGARWLVVQPLNRANFEDPSVSSVSSEPSCVVYDSMGARAGDWIGFTEGSEATLPFERPTPVDAYNAIIIDQVQFTADRD